MKQMQNIVIFIELTKRKYSEPSKIGNLFINRFIIDEEASSEILKVFELDEVNLYQHPECENQGKDLVLNLTYMLASYDNDGPI